MNETTDFENPKGPPRGESGTDPLWVLEEEGDVLRACRITDAILADTEELDFYVATWLGCWEEAAERGLDPTPASPEREVVHAIVACGGVANAFSGSRLTPADLGDLLRDPCALMEVAFRLWEQRRKPIASGQQHSTARQRERRPRRERPHRAKAPGGSDKGSAPLPQCPGERPQVPSPGIFFSYSSDFSGEETPMVVRTRGGPPLRDLSDTGHVEGDRGEEVPATPAQEHVVAVLVEAGLGEEQANHLLARIPRQRLSTLTRDDLQGIVGHYRAWYPLVEYFENPGFRAWLPDQREHEIERQAEDVLAHLQNRLRKRASHAEAEDATAEAVYRALGSGRGSTGGYFYDTDFREWLARRALRYLASKRKSPAQLQPDVPVSGTLSVRAWAELLQRWQGRFELVLTFFREENHQRIRAIWENMVSRQSSDRELAERAAGELNVSIPRSTIASSRRHLRRRLEALRYILDVPGDVPDAEPEDTSVVRHVARIYRGEASGDEWALRNLSNLARVAIADPQSEQHADTLRWARFSRLVVDKRSPVQEAMVSAIPEPERQDPASATTVSRRLERAAASTRKHAEGFPRLQRRLRQDNASFLLSSLWYAGVLLELSETRTLDVLNPPANLEGCIRDVSRQLR